MTYLIKQPHPDTFLGKNNIAAVYAELANIPLYLGVRIITFKPLIGKRTSFRLNWVIQDKRWARNSDLFIVPQSMLDWAAVLIVGAYPDVEQSTGLTTDEVNAIKAEQTAKRAKHVAERAKNAV